jgi:soluble lytic murein transglycosylase
VDECAGICTAAIIKRPALWLLLVWLLAGHPAAATDASGSADPEAGRRDFIAAMQRVRLHLPEPPDSPALEAYVLHDYLTAARLRSELQQKPSEDLDATIDSFQKAHTGEPVMHNLRREWLESLADRQRWDWFLARARDVTDPRLACDRLQALLATGGPSLATEALARWSQPQKQPSECDGVFAWLRSQGLLTPALAESRTRAALAAENARLAREFLADVPPPRAAPLLQWADLLSAPLAPLTRLADDPTLSVEPDALAAGFNRLSDIDAAAAAQLLPQLLARPDMTPALRARLGRSAALGLAYAHAPAAAAFGALAVDGADSQVQEWRARSALWAGDFKQALEWIDRMPSSLASQPRWRYWRARATAATQGNDAAAPLFEAIAGLRDYYGYLAADRLHRPYNLNARPSPDEATVQAALAAESGMVRAHELFDCDMTDEAILEWAVAAGGLQQDIKIQAARLAARWGWYAQSISALAQAGEWDDVRLRYPRPFPEAVEAAAKLSRLPPDWILAVMRQESLFRKDAVSRADARGLMQVQPATAAVARRWHLPAPGRDSLFDPAVGAALGAAYLREMLDRYGDQLGVTLAAYNAGPIAVARWMPPKAMDADIWIENITYSETRGYVQHIIEHMVAYAWVRDAELPRLAALLPPIVPAANLLR